MKQTLRFLCLSVLGLAALIVGSPDRAGAMNELVSGHWPYPQGSIQYIDYDGAQSYAGIPLGNYVGTGGSTWQYWSGIRFALADSPRGPGTYENYWIKIQLTSRASLRLLNGPGSGCDKPTAVGCTSVRQSSTFSGNGHIIGTVTRVCNDCGLSWQQVQSTVTHELGHAIGLGHNTGETNSVMCGGRSDCNSVSQEVTWHDWWALQVKYNPAYYYSPYHGHS